MATQTFDIPGTGKGGTDYRVRVTDTRESTGSKTATGENQYVTFNRGKTDHLRLEPMLKNEVSFTAFNDVNLEQITDAAEDEIEVTVKNVSSGLVSPNLVWQGYAFPRRYVDSPLLPWTGVVMITAHDGRPLLKNKSFGDLSISSNDKVSPKEIIESCLGSVYSTDLPIEVGMNWWPKASALGSTDFPLTNVYVDPDNYQKDRRSDEAIYVSQWDALADICKAFGFNVRQVRRGGELRWHIRHPYGVDSTGSIPMWTIATDGTVTSEGSTDLTFDLQARVDSDDYFVEPRHRRFVSARNEILITHDCTTVKNALKNGDFEAIWEDWSAPSSNVTSTIKNHDLVSDTPDSSNINEYVANVQYDSSNVADVVNNEIGFEQDFRLVRPNKDAGLRFKWSGWIFQDLIGIIQLENGGSYITDKTVNLRGAQKKGEAVLPVDPVANPIMKGGTVAIYDTNDDFKTRTEATQRVDTGDDEIPCELDIDVQKGWYVQYPGWQGSTGYCRITEYVPPDEKESWKRHSISVPYQDENGNRLSDQQMTFGIGVVQSLLNSGIVHHYFDNLELFPIRNDRKYSEVTSEATTDSFGQTDTLRHRTGSGPTENNIARIRGDKEYSTLYSVVDAGQDPQDDYWVEFSGDVTADFTVGELVDWINNSSNEGSYTIKEVNYVSSSDETRLDFEEAIADTTNTDGSIGRQADKSEWTGFQWGVSSSATNHYPLSELHARERLKRFRQQNPRFKIDPRPFNEPILFYGHEVFTYNGNNHTVSALTAQPTQGDRPITILRDKDYGTA